MRRRYPRGFKEEMILKFESLSPKMRYIDFAKENDIPLETLKTWIYDSRQKKKARAGIVEIKTKVSQKNQEEKISVHITLNTGTSIHVVLNQSQFIELIWKTP